MVKFEINKGHDIVFWEAISAHWKGHKFPIARASESELLHWMACGIPH